MSDPEYDLVINVFSDLWPLYERLGYEGLTEEEKVIFCTWQFVCEVNNGGFSQYFANPSGKFCVETIDALEKANMRQAASSLRHAVNAFPDNRPAKEHGLRCAQLDALPNYIQDKMFDEFTGAFFDSTEDPYQLQADYIEQNRKGFTSLQGSNSKPE